MAGPGGRRLLGVRVPRELRAVCHKGVIGNAGEQLLTRACGDRTRGNGFKLAEGKFRYREKSLPREGDEALVRVARGTCRCPIPARAHGRVGWGSGQRALVKGVLFLPTVERLELDDLAGLFQPKPFRVSFKKYPGLFLLLSTRLTYRTWKINTAVQYAASILLRCCCLILTYFAVVLKQK